MQREAQEHHLDHGRVSVLVFAFTAWTKLLLLAFDFLGVSRQNHRIAIAETKTSTLMTQLDHNGLPFVRRNVVDHEDAVVVLLCVVHHRVYARTYAFAALVFVALSLKRKFGENKTMKDFVIKTLQISPLSERKTEYK